MSYILDALKRAEAERERGAAPGLHTRHQTPAGNAGTPSERRPVWLAAAAGLTLLVLATTFWLLRTPDAPPMAALKPTASPTPKSVAPASPIAEPAEPVVQSTPLAATTPMAPVPIVIAEAPPARPKPTEKTSPRTVTEPPTTDATPAVPAKPAKPAVPATPIKDAAVTAAAAPASKAASAPTAAQAAPLLAELPAELRSQIPKITITGSVYSDSPAQRLLLVNNLVLAQGWPGHPRPEAGRNPAAQLGIQLQGHPLSRDALNPCQGLPSWGNVEHQHVNMRIVGLVGIERDQIYH